MPAKIDAPRPQATAPLPRPAAPAPAAPPPLPAGPAPRTPMAGDLEKVLKPAEGGPAPAADIEAVVLPAPAPEPVIVAGPQKSSGVSTGRASEAARARAPKAAPAPVDPRTRAAKDAEATKTTTEGSLLAVTARDGRNDWQNLKAESRLKGAAAAEAATSGAADAAKQEFVATQKAYAGAKGAERKAMKPALKRTHEAMEAAKATAAAAKGEVKAATAAVAAADAADLTKLGKTLAVAGGAAGGVVGVLTVDASVAKLQDPAAAGYEKAAATFDVVGGTTDVVAGTATVARALGAGAGVGTAAKVLGPVGVAVGGVADMIEGGGKAITELTKDDGKPTDYEKVAQGSTKALGGGLMVAGAIATATGAGAVVGVPLMVAGGVLSVGASVWEMFSD